jgi:hypothetical protein
MSSPAISGLRGQARVARDSYERFRRRPRSVRGRLAALEAEVQENRQLNRRIAELVDVVAELLVPLEDRDEDRAREVLAQYRSSI